MPESLGLAIAFLNAVAAIFLPVFSIEQCVFTRAIGPDG